MAAILADTNGFAFTNACYRPDPHANPYANLRPFIIYSIRNPSLIHIGSHTKHHSNTNRDVDPNSDSLPYDHTDSNADFDTYRDIHALKYTDSHRYTDDYTNTDTRAALRSKPIATRRRP